MSKEWVPGLEGIVAAESNISFIDGQEGILEYEDSISKRSRITAPSKRQPTCCSRKSSHSGRARGFLR